MNKNNRGFCKKYKVTPREYRELRHMGEMYAKEMKRDYDRAKSKHTIGKRWNKGHKAWSVEDSK